MARAEALALIGSMLENEPGARATVAALLRHVFWLDATAKLERVRPVTAALRPRPRTRLISTQSSSTPPRIPRGPEHIIGNPGRSAR
jgi:hypothetical protein